MEGLIKLLKEIPGPTLFFAALFVCIALGIIVEGLVRILKPKSRSGKSN